MDVPPKVIDNQHLCRYALTSVAAVDFTSPVKLGPERVSRGPAAMLNNRCGVFPQALRPFYYFRACSDFPYETGFQPRPDVSFGSITSYISFNNMSINNLNNISTNKQYKFNNNNTYNYIVLIYCRIRYMGGLRNGR
jgi:hypothetical protein